jgi:hypothetical protein
VLAHRPDCLGVTHGYGVGAAHDRLVLQSTQSELVGAWSSPSQEEVGVSPFGLFYRDVRDIVPASEVQWRAMGFHRARIGGPTQWALIDRALDERLIEIDFDASVLLRMEEAVMVMLVEQGSEDLVRAALIAEAVSGASNTTYPNPLSFATAESADGPVVEAWAQLGDVDRLVCQSARMAIRRFIWPVLQEQIRSTLSRRAREAIAMEIADSFRRLASV